VDLQAAVVFDDAAGGSSTFSITLFKRTRDTPLQFPTISVDVRRALLHTFPYAVYFRETEQAVVILPVLHVHRDPRIWRHRA